MRAAVIKEPGAPEVFEIQEIEDPILQSFKSNVVFIK